MEILLQCRACSTNINIELNHESTQLVECFQCRQKNLFIFQSMLFEFLFDLGCLAYFDGYYREAIFNFSSSLEIFRKFFITTVLNKKGFSNDEIKILWESFSKYSQRQLGAYNVLYFLEFNKPIEKTKIEKNIREFLNDNRNKTIHNGEFITKEDTIKYGSYVFEEIKDVYLQIIDNNSLSSYLLLDIERRDIKKIIRSNFPSTTVAIPGFQLVRTGKANNFSEFLEQLRKDLQHEGSWYKSRNIEMEKAS